MPPDPLTPEEVAAEVAGLFLGSPPRRRAPGTSQARPRRARRVDRLDQRRTVRQFDAVAVGGPADGLRLRVEVMSDGSSFVPAGRGSYLPLSLGLHGAVVLAELAEACLSANSDEPEQSEVRAARKVLERVEAATGGRVAYDGWNVTLDGERLPL